jgi:hypothetical protein
MEKFQLKWKKGFNENVSHVEMDCLLACCCVFGNMNRCRDEYTAALVLLGRERESEII